MKQGLNTTHSELPRGYCKLDKDLINEINHKDAPTSFDGEFDDFDIDHNNNPVRATVHTPRRLWRSVFHNLNVSVI